jgi:hypothetical protein
MLIQHSAQSGLGLLALTAVVVGSVLVFVKLRQRPVTRHGLVALTALGFLFFPFAFLGVCLPLANMARV